MTYVSDGTWCQAVLPTPQKNQHRDQNKKKRTNPSSFDPLLYIETYKTRHSTTRKSSSGSKRRDTRDKRTTMVSSSSWWTSSSSSTGCCGSLLFFLVLSLDVHAFSTQRAYQRGVVSWNQSVVTNSVSWHGNLAPPASIPRHSRRQRQLRQSQGGIHPPQLTVASSSSSSSGDNEEEESTSAQSFPSIKEGLPDVRRRQILFSMLSASSLSPFVVPRARAADDDTDTTTTTTTAVDDNDSLLPVEVIVPPLDDRDYVTYTLDNGLRVLLCSDPSTTEAAVAMDVHVGATSDPWEIPGLAHFTEHMLFLGTKQYPQENSFEAFLSNNGGSSNAYTDSENTVYYFDMQAEASSKFMEGLSRFGSFFSDPLFTEAATGRELNAIESENKVRVCVCVPPLLLLSLSSRRTTTTNKQRLVLTHSRLAFDRRFGWDFLCPTCSLFRSLSFLTTTSRKICKPTPFGCFRLPKPEPIPIIPLVNFLPATSIPCWIRRPHRALTCEPN